MIELSNFPIYSSTELQNNLTMASGVIIIKQGRLLVVRDSNESKFSFAGGICRVEESPLGTAQRELYEELSLQAEVESEPFIYLFESNEKAMTNVVFLYHFFAVNIQGEIKLGSDAHEVQWKKPDDNFNDCFPNVYPAFKYFFGKYGSTNGI